MKRYMLLHVGFEKPTPEMMSAWMTWFGAIAERQVAQGGFAAGREVSRDGTRDLAWDSSALTGYNIIEAESLDAATEIAMTCPFVSSIRIHELRAK